MAEFIQFENHLVDVQSEAYKQMQLALELCGQAAEGYAKKLCPVDSGALRNSINHHVSEDLEVTIGTNMEYAPYIEFGTGIYYPGGRRTPWFFKDPKGNWHRMWGIKAQPFLRPAAADHTSQYLKIIEKSLKGEL